MADYPTIHGAIITQLPYTEALEFYNSVEVMDSDEQVAFNWVADPFHVYVVRYQVLTDAELAILENFWVSMKGPLGSFTFTGEDGTPRTKCIFADETFRVQYVGVNQHTVELTILALP
jgi:hypothetical protein